MIKSLAAQFCLMAIVLSATPALSETQLVFPQHEQLSTLKEKYRQEFKTQLAQKPLEERSIGEIYDIALQAAQTAYGDQPDLMRQKFSHDLAQIPTFESKQLKNYRLEQSLDLLTLFQTSQFSELGSTQADVLAIFYGKHPEAIAKTFKNMMLSRVLSPKQLGYQSVISRFLPDQVYRLPQGQGSALVIQSFDDDLFVLNFEVTQLGLFKPLTMQWMRKFSPRG